MIAHCKGCRGPHYQDKLYGMRCRVHTLSTEKKQPRYRRCTVCGTQTAVDTGYQAPKKRKEK